MIYENQPDSILTDARIRYFHDNDRNPMTEVSSRFLQCVELLGHLDEWEIEIEIEDVLKNFVDL